MVERGEDTRTRVRLLEAALEGFGEDGFARSTLASISARAGVEPRAAIAFFASKEHLVLALYESLAIELAERVAELPRGSAGRRFAEAVRIKLGLLERRPRAYRALEGHAWASASKLGILSQESAMVRARVCATFEVVVEEATNAPAREAARAELARTLYAAHLGFIALWTREPRATELVLRPLAAALDRAIVPLIEQSGRARRLLAEVDVIMRDLVGLPRVEEDDDRARAVVDRLLRGRRLRDPSRGAPSRAARALVLPLVRAAIDEDRPLELVLPAFPAKSPNPRKVLGALPDAAEHLALESLATLVRDCEAILPAGARLVICSDGHVFADAVGVSDAEVDAYRVALEAMLAPHGDRLRFFGLEDVRPDADAASARAWLLDRYGEPVDTIRARAASSPVLRAQVDGIHRFMVEDAMGRDPTLSRSRAQKITRALAYEVVQRSEAWGRLVAEVFPRAVRLSIHPQPEVSDKIGVHLIPTDDEWLTPWHGVAAYDDGRVRLVHRKDAEALGARVVEHGGRPWAMELPRA